MLPADGFGICNLTQNCVIVQEKAFTEQTTAMKRPDYRTLQALDAVIRERGFERAAQKLCITQSAVSQRIKQLENMFGQPLLVRTVPPRPTEQGQKLLALLRRGVAGRRVAGR